MCCTLVTFGGSFIFFLTFDGSIVTLGNTNITSDCTFATFGNTLFFFVGDIIQSNNGKTRLTQKTNKK